MNHRKPNRRSIRLRDWDYRSEGYYFVTFCTHQRECLFDDPRLHEIATLAWDYIPQQPHAQTVALDERIIMPNHGHGLLRITVDPAIPLAETDHPRGPLAGSVGVIMGNYKMLVTKRVKAMLKASDTDMKVWQRGYWERIIRNERELNAIRRYIQENPRRWHEDRDNLDRLLDKMVYVDGP
ncbi:MAG: transposase [Ardenticatenaceae bacterium]|nr:transposase [Ardenticatenaceae bacterium]MCB9443375.1 transposase [Ardenticatenaceae bacterium]